MTCTQQSNQIRCYGHNSNHLINNEEIIGKLESLKSNLVELLG